MNHMTDKPSITGRVATLLVSDDVVTTDDVQAGKEFIEKDYSKDFQELQESILAFQNSTHLDLALKLTETGPMPWRQDLINRLNMR